MLDDQSGKLYTVLDYGKQLPRDRPTLTSPQKVLLSDRLRLGEAYYFAFSVTIYRVRNFKNGDSINL